MASSKAALASGSVASPSSAAGPSESKACSESMIAIDDGLCIDRFEVTSAQYDACVAEGRCGKPLVGGLCTSGRAGHLPINCVGFDLAEAYCRAMDKRLPTEAEWVKAAGEATYPWGTDPPAKQLCWDGTGNDLGHGNRHELCPVGSYPGDRSPFGVMDMGGGVSEWTVGATTSRSDEQPRRGGSWGSKQGPALVSVKARRSGGWKPYDVGIFVGFRCAFTRT